MLLSAFHVCLPTDSNQYKHKQVESIAEYQENGIVINSTIRAKYFTIEILGADEENISWLILMSEFYKQISPNEGKLRSSQIFNSTNALLTQTICFIKIDEFHTSQTR